MSATGFKLRQRIGKVLNLFKTFRSVVFDVSIIFLLLYPDYSRAITDIHICTYLKANGPAVLGQKYVLSVLEFS